MACHGLQNHATQIFFEFFGNLNGGIRVFTGTVAVMDVRLSAAAPNRWQPVDPIRLCVPDYPEIIPRAGVLLIFTPLAFSSATLDPVRCNVFVYDAASISSP